MRPAGALLCGAAVGVLATFAAIWWYLKEALR
jgi:hypothetical protein